MQANLDIGEYIELIFKTWIMDELQTCDRIDIIWGLYKVCSQRRARIHGKVSEHDKLPQVGIYYTSNISSSDFPSDKVIYVISGI